MNKDELKQILLDYGINRIGQERYYTDLALVFCKAYIRTFTKEKILTIKDESSSIKASRLPMEGLFRKNETEDLMIRDTHIFYLNDNPYFEMDLKKQIKKIWFDGGLKPLYSVLYVEDFLNSINDKDKSTILEQLREYQDQQIFLSYFYRYVLALLEENIKTDFDYARNGCFTNAYFDIINYNKIDFDNKRNI